MHWLRSWIRWIALVSLSSACASEQDATLPAASANLFEEEAIPRSGESVHPSNEPALRWSRLRTSGAVPPPRSAPSAAILEGGLYMFGGVFDDFRAARNVFYSDFHRLGLGNRQWSLVSTVNAPSPRAFAPAVSDLARRRILIFGGSDYDYAFDHVQMYDDLWSFAPEEAQWTQLRPMDRGPSGRSGASLWLLDSRLYVFGGVAADFTTRNDLWMLDLAALKWTLLIPDGDSRSPSGRHSAQVSQRPDYGRITLYGGEGYDPGTDQFTQPNDTWEFDVGTSVWIDVTPASARNIHPARTFAASAAMGGVLFVQGGDEQGGSQGCGAPFPQNVTRELWGFDIARRAWSMLTASGDPMPALKRTGYAAHGNTLYVVAGWDFSCPNGDGPGQIWNADVYALTLEHRSSDDWLGFPVNICDQL